MLSPPQMVIPVSFIFNSGSFVIGRQVVISERAVAGDLRARFCLNRYRGQQGRAVMGGRKIAQKIEKMAGQTEVEI